MAKMTGANIETTLFVVWPIDSMDRLQGKVGPILPLLWFDRVHYTQSRILPSFEGMQSYTRHTWA